MPDESKRLVRFDWAMKNLLRDKANFDVLEGFLSALFEDDSLRVLKLLESEGNQEEETDKFNRVDLLVEDGEGRKIIIEIQNTREVDYLERIIFGTSKLVVENLKLGEPYTNIDKVISVSILYFNLGTGDDYLYHGKTELRGMNSNEVLKLKKKEEDAITGKITLKDKNPFPEYYIIEVNRFQNRVKKRIDEWVYLIKNNEISENANSKYIDRAKEKLNYLNMSPEERKRHDRFLGNLARERDILSSEREEGREEGRKESEAEIQRLRTEQERIAAEKQKAEQERLQAEAEKQKAEQERLQAEAEKQEAEARAEVFRLHYAENQTAEEVATHLNRSLDWVKAVLG